MTDPAIWESLEQDISLLLFTYG